MTAKELLEQLQDMGDPERAAGTARYFQVKQGGYGEGDVFIGIRVPELRKLARRWRGMELTEVVKLLRSPYHEARLLALLLLVEQYRRAAPAEKEAIVELYLQNSDRINNWDLVDTSAPHILGAYIYSKSDRGLLDELAASPSVWERRMALLATFHFIRQGEFGETLRLVKKLLDDPEDLIHKAAGWMLREMGKRDEKLLLDFLEENAARMPRTMLRYATEKLTPEQKRRFRGSDRRQS